MVAAAPRQGGCPFTLDPVRDSIPLVGHYTPQLYPDGKGLVVLVSEFTANASFQLAMWRFRGKSQPSPASFLWVTFESTAD